MSADNWGKCPKCEARHFDRREELAVLLETQYGRVSRSEYKVLEEELAGMPKKFDEYELREDYEFYLEGTRFTADYHAQCCNDDCDFEFTFKHQEDVDIK